MVDYTIEYGDYPLCVLRSPISGIIDEDIVQFA
jgi:hypothetical protein